MTLSTHVLDTARGLPADGIVVSCYAVDPAIRTLVAQSITNSDGRTDSPLAMNLPPGIYEIVFATGPYFARRATPAFYDEIAVRFTVSSGNDRYHVPLLLAPWGYSTYRGS